MQQKVVDKYFDFHKGSWSSDDKALNKTRFSFKGHLGINSTDLVGKHEAKLIAGFIYGDLGFRLPSYEQSLTYANGKGIYLIHILTIALRVLRTLYTIPYLAGIEIFNYYFNTEFPIDMILRADNPYGTGHGADVPFTMGWYNNPGKF